MGLKLGIARETITPEIGGFFAGYDSPNPSTSVHDDLTATAFLFEQNGTKALLVSVTVCLVHNGLTERLRKECGAAAGLPAEHVILSATHTHSGPVLFGSKLDNTYIESIFVPRCVAAAKEAAKAPVPVKVGIAATKSLVGINRRQVLPDNSVKLGQNPWGAYDPEMTVISFKDESGKTIGSIVHCSAHCTASGANTEVTRDWAGVMIDRLDAESGGVTLFVNGTLGDVAPRMANGDSVGNIGHAMEVGGLAGIDAVRAYKDIRVYRDECLAMALGEIRIPYKPLMSLERVNELMAEVEAYENKRFAASRINHLNEVKKFHEKGETDGYEFVLPQTLLRIGPAVMVPIPFEPCSEIGLRLRAYSRFGHTLSLGCTNGSNSYLPTQDQICRGGYEVEQFKWGGPRELPDDADWWMVKENLRIMEGFK
jgi:hypothetical protein